MRAISALDIALWDILGQAAGQPIYNLLGGRVRDSIRTYNTCASYGDMRDYEAFHERPVELAESLLAEGITAMKIWPFDVFARRPNMQESEHQHRRQGTVGSARTLVGMADGQYIEPGRDRSGRRGRATHPLGGRRAHGDRHRDARACGISRARCGSLGRSNRTT